MSMKKNLMIALVAVVAMGASVAIAQTTTYEIKQGTVLHVYGNHLVVQMADGTVRDADIPSDFLFEVDGRKVPVSQLKPGTKLTQTIATTSTPHVVKTTEVKEGTVVQRIGQTLIYRDKLGQIHKVTGIPEGFQLYRNGKAVPIEALAGGDRVTAHIVHKEESIITEEDMRVAGAAPKAPKAKPAPVTRRAAPKPAPPVLPKTGSDLPLVGFAGLFALVFGLGIAAIRRF
jgi:LPXTG-motif cell wall-anchored protein